LEQTPDSLGSRATLAAHGEDLKRRFLDGESVAALVRERADIVDHILKDLWQEHVGELADQIALVAVGGYGRAELHPYSDVDIMLLLPGPSSEAGNDRISAFVVSMWDVGLEIGHSVRTVEQCLQEAEADLTVTTTLMEARLINGPQSLFLEMQQSVGPDRIWPSKVFFEEKRKEQVERHFRNDDTAYKLEPNVKRSPGGLRDIQMIGWVAKRHFGCNTLDELVDHEFLTPGQLTLLHDGQSFLWRVRFALHIITGRREDRILFDHQINLANLLGYEDATYTLAVEQLMQRYYRTVMDLSRLNEMLLQSFEEVRRRKR